MWLLNLKDHNTMWPWDTWGHLPFLLSSAVITLFCIVVYRAALPKPIPGIPHRSEGARHVLGDIPAMLEATTKGSDVTHVQWIQRLVRELDSPLIQVLTGPFSRPTVVLADFREAQDVLMRRREEWDRSDVLADLFGGLIPDHHSLHKTSDPTWKARRRLLQDLMSRPFLHDVAAPALYANARMLIALWARKAHIAGGRPFSTREDIYGAALDAVHAFAFGEGFEYSATRPQLELLEGLGADEIERMIPHPGGGDEDEPVCFPSAKLHDVVDATLSLAAACETVQGQPSMRLAWKLLQMKPQHRRAKRVRDACIRRELAQAVSNMMDVPKPLQGQDGGGPDYQQGRQHASGAAAGGDSTYCRVRRAVDHMVQREKQLAEKDGRQPEYFSPAMMTEIFGFVITGHDTSSTAILWGLKYMSDNQAPQRHLRSVLQASFSAAKAENRDPTMREITCASIPYLDAVTEEILRCAGTIPVIDRQASADTVVLGRRIPRGTTMYILTSGPSIHQSPAFEIDERARSESCRDAKREGRYRGEWNPGDIGSFRPERWLVSSAGSANDGDGDGGSVEFSAEAGPNLPFGLGMRSCFGRRLAALELRIMVVLIVWNFELLPCPQQLSGYASKMGVTSKPVQCFVRLRKVTYTSST
ncbi:hypothetical protein FJTKL_03196 [Diaporthe vaccinii]|uniref:Cytochrome P450 n=1 Tax=Diaporthe vaccinii TaxID=105482 RepID=A0ABR4DVN2_9PEZI